MPTQPKSLDKTKPNRDTKAKSITGKPGKSTPHRVTKSTARKTTKSTNRKASSPSMEKQPAGLVRPEGGNIKGPLTWKQARLLVDLSQSQFSKEVRSLNFTQFPFNSWRKDLKKNRQYVLDTFPDKTLTKRISGSNDEFLVLGLMLGQAFKGFENLKSITLDFSTPKHRPLSGLSQRSEPFSHALGQIEKPLLLKVFYERGFFTLTWSGNKRGQDEISISNCQPNNVPFWLDGDFLAGRSPAIFRATCLTLVEPMILEPMEIVEFHSVIEKKPAGLACAIDYSFAESLRKLSIINCETADKKDDWNFMFKALLLCGRLETLRFQSVGGVRFDWDGDGKLDDGSKVPQMVEQIGMKATLQKMISAYRNIYA
ncbi:uncharacterized protein BKA78DRAFT_299677 [Phyllosticta capitalensis]|uniref:uncharacterized protein n=1 Tax=Phyllosticta capitalensis TaxID=121624 RepID=UPI00312D18F5